MQYSIYHMTFKTHFIHDCLQKYQYSAISKRDVVKDVVHVTLRDVSS